MPRLRRTLAAALVPIVLTMGIATAARAAATDTLTVDLAADTGAFRGGATGTLYGLSSEGVPSQAVLNGARVTNTSQRPPDGLQHPTGDALKVERSFFAGAGKDLYVYLQDMYPDWPYTAGTRPGDADGDGVWDYLPLLREAVEKVATRSARPKDYVFLPFNEPDGIWYQDWPTERDQFLADWSAAYRVIQEVWAAHGLGHARIGGPGDSRWHADRSADFLGYAQKNGQLPDVFIWHELGIDNLATFRGNFAAYRDLEKSLGVAAIPVNITEYALPRDMGAPGSLIQWLTMFEDVKADAQTAYWSYAGGLSDNISRTNGANGGWWMFKWYGDLAGSRTVKVTPPRPNTVATLQGIAARDAANDRTTVLFGGGADGVNLVLRNVTGSQVDVQVRAVRLNGAEGATGQPPVVLSTRATVTDGTVSVTVPNDNQHTAYQAIVTPVLPRREPVANPLVSSVEAETGTLVDATVFNRDDGWTQMASNRHDVGDFKKATSSITWQATVPRTGTYRLSVLAGTNSLPGRHALFVDGGYHQLVRYPATLAWGYRGNADVTLRLTAGTHTFALKGSTDGVTALPNVDIAVDRFDLYDVTDSERTVYPVLQARLSGGAKLVDGAASLSGSGKATFFVAAAETGYHDLSVGYGTKNAAAIDVRADGRTLKMPASKSAGSWVSTARVFLPQGISEITVTAAAGAQLSSITTARAAAADSDQANVYRAQAESLPRAGTAAVASYPKSTGVFGSEDAGGTVSYVGFVGLGAGNTVTLNRPSSFGAGDYVLTVGAANAERSGSHSYNPQVVDRFIDVTEAGGGTTRGAVRTTYAWTNFWDKSIPVTTTTASGALTLGNATAYAPDLDTVSLARLVAGTPTTTAR